MNPAEQAQRNRRWRLALGRAAAPLAELNDQDARWDQAMDYLYRREGEGAGADGDRDGRDRHGSPDGSGLMTPTDWINEVYQLFPRSVAEKLADDALNRYGLTEIVTSAEALERVTPSMALVKAILNTKQLMEPPVLSMAREIIAKVVRDLLRQLAQPVRNPFSGPKDRNRRSRIAIAANFDPKATLRANLKHFDADSGQLVIAEPLFHTRVRRQQDRWQVIICVDQSGSMADSVIYSAVTAAIFHGIGSLRTHLIAFDTEVADLSDQVADPVDVLMGVQLGGGTDIGRAVRYAAQLVDTPRRTMVVIISDFYEGGSAENLHSAVGGLVGSGAKVLLLGALSVSGEAFYDRHTVAQLVELGADFAVMSPDRLAEWVAEVIG